MNNYFRVVSYLFFGVLFFFSPCDLLSQSTDEICNNSIDDDGDGFIDLDDPECFCYVENLIPNPGFEKISDCCGPSMDSPVTCLED